MKYLLNFCNQDVIMLAMSILSLIPLIFFIKKILFITSQRYITKHYHDYEEILKKHSIYRYLLHSLLSLYCIFWGHLFHTNLSSVYLLTSIKNIGVNIYTSSSITMLLLALIDLASDIYQNKIAVSAKLTFIALYTQIFKVCVASIAVIITVPNLLNISLGTFFTSFGATTALLTFVFKDTILGLLASLQLTFQEIIRVGDWIRIAQYNVEGTVEKITITVVSIRNSDQTISTIPTYGLLTTNITNWREINESGVRRIQRALYVDMNSITFCSTSILERLRNSPHLSNILDKMNFNDLKDHVTNVQMFRLYIEGYLKNNPAIYTQDFTFLVRQLAPTSNGLPIELYAFTKATGLVEYEKIQTNIFEHLLAVLPEFKLKIFQNKYMS